MLGANLHIEPVLTREVVFLHFSQLFTQCVRWDDAAADIGLANLLFNVDYRAMRFEF